MAGKTNSKKTDSKLKSKTQKSDAEANQEHMHQTSTTNADNTRNPDAAYERDRETSRQLESNPIERDRLTEEGKHGAAKS